LVQSDFYLFLKKTGCLQSDAPPSSGPLEHISRKIESPSEQVAGSTYLRPGGGGWGYPQITGYDKLIQGGYTTSGAMYVRVTFHFEDCVDGIEALTI